MVGENSGESCIPRGEGVGCVDGDSLPVLFDLMGRSPFVARNKCRDARTAEDIGSPDKTSRVDFPERKSACIQCAGTRTGRHHWQEREKWLLLWTILLAVIC